LKLLPRILITIVVTLAVIFVLVNWVAPVGLSFYAAKKTPAVARVVPTELKDHSVADVPGSRLAYVGYEFEVPWNDLDDAQTKFYPKNAAEKNRVDLHFRSGLRLIVTAIPPHEWSHNLAAESKVSSEDIEAEYGAEAMKSDYSFVKTLYEFTPGKMNHWQVFRGTHARDQLLLILKSLMPLKAAESGIFNIQNQDYKGFQQGAPQMHPDGVAINLYRDDGSIEMLFQTKDYRIASGLTQAELNRVIGSVRRVPQNIPAAARAEASVGKTQAALPPKN